MEFLDRRKKTLYPGCSCTEYYSTVLHNGVNFIIGDGDLGAVDQPPVQQHCLREIVGVRKVPLVRKLNTPRGIYAFLILDKERGCHSGIMEMALTRPA